LIVLAFVILTVGSCSSSSNSPILAKSTQISTATALRATQAPPAEVWKPQEIEQATAPESCTPVADLPKNSQTVLEPGIYHS